MEEMIKTLVDTGKWGEEDVKIGIRASFKCEYCDKDLLESVDNYKEWQVDHIIPKSKGGEESFENSALSCRTCNVNIKSRWNPVEITGEDATRDQLITAVRKYVRDKRTEILADVSFFRKTVFCK